MCGRYSLATTKAKMEEEFGIELGDEQLSISFNIAPTHEAYVITNESPEKLSKLNWGLIPAWSKDGKLTGKLINARVEGISTKPSFRMAIRKRRCLVIADSFYEWRREGTKKIPYRIFPKDGELMAFAGIWESWGPNKSIKTFSILTMESNDDLNDLHNRMPIFFTRPSQQQKWLSDLTLDETLEMLEQPTSDYLTKYRVTEQMNLPINNFKQIHEEVPEPPTLFG